MPPLKPANALMTDPGAVVSGLVDACQAGLAAYESAVDGTALCIDNLNPFAGMRKDFATAFSTNCLQESGRSFGHGLVNLFSTLAPGAKGAKVVPPIHRVKQNSHVKGMPDYNNRVKQGKPTSAWLPGEDPDALTYQAWEKGTPGVNNPNVRILDFGRPIGEGMWGGTQTQVRVVMNGKGEIHGTPWGPVTK